MISRKIMVADILAWGIYLQNGKKRGCVFTWKFWFYTGYILSTWINFNSNMANQLHQLYSVYGITYPFPNSNGAAILGLKLFHVRKIGPKNDEMKFGMCLLATAVHSDRILFQNITAMCDLSVNFF